MLGTDAMTLNFHDRVTVTIADHIAHVLLDRADKMNALDDAMFDALIDAAGYLRADAGIRAVVLSGAGRAFCAGLDLSNFGNSGSGATDRRLEISLAERTHGRANRVQYVATAWRDLPMPVIAAVHGVCFGGGLQIASGADIRIVAPDARMAVMEVKWGLVPDMGGFLLWRGNVRDDVLRELTYTHREFTGAEAMRLGFATHADADPLARATALAQEIAAKSPHAVRASKDLCNRTPFMDADAVLLAESVAQIDLLHSPNQIESVRAGMERRRPEFVDP
ncbi:enoyl-CoA hydratase [Novosphingobium nitrogenifigens DSM 19370]|uniref:Enoyl-CoA hydratase n=1 Tax=Novosphingobium nitrogenifigens DSM 19370 TaxID=983920 RepID=F1ZC96_9SPHN|nr:crotonase/enoyl-CoA hydratase family protein [Novosphingobium nitrogenifigens]EGD57697.1 enoyl-CoA hydratase [Novosphingobium nitrogenifigens DSM 19370]